MLGSVLVFSALIFVLPGIRAYAFISCACTFTFNISSTEECDDLCSSMNMYSSNCSTIENTLECEQMDTECGAYSTLDCIEMCESLGMDYSDFQELCLDDDGIMLFYDESGNAGVFFAMFICYIFGFIFISILVSGSGCFERRIDHIVTESNKNLCALMDLQHFAESGQIQSENVIGDAKIKRCFCCVKKSVQPHQDGSSRQKHSPTSCIRGRRPQLRHDYIEMLVEKAPYYYAAMPIDTPDKNLMWFPPGFYVSRFT